MTPDLSRLLARAEHLQAIGQTDGAIETLRQILTLDPDLADAHARLALCLLQKRRLHAATVEAARALALDPDAPLSHWTAAEVALAKRDFKAAEAHIALLRAALPEEPAADLLLARCYGLTGREKASLPLLAEARRKDPTNPAVLAALAEHHAMNGDKDLALGYAEEALRQTPEHQGALVAMGTTLLVRGDAAGAREHAVLALRADPTDPAALQLLASIKTRTNPFLGLWWRYAVWGERVGPARQIFVLMIAFILYAVAVIYSRESGQAAVANGIQIAWLAVVAYSFVGPMLFRQALRKELQEVALRRF